MGCSSSRFLSLEKRYKSLCSDAKRVNDALLDETVTDTEVQQLVAVFLRDLEGTLCEPAYTQRAHTTLTAHTPHTATSSSNSSTDCAQRSSHSFIHKNTNNNGNRTITSEQLSLLQLCNEVKALRDMLRVRRARVLHATCEETSVSLPSSSSSSSSSSSPSFSSSWDRGEGSARAQSLVVKLRIREVLDRSIAALEQRLVCGHTQQPCTQLCTQAHTQAHTQTHTNTHTHTHTHTHTQAQDAETSAQTETDEPPLHISVSLSPSRSLSDVEKNISASGREQTQHNDKSSSSDRDNATIDNSNNDVSASYIDVETGLGVGVCVCADYDEEAVIRVPYYKCTDLSPHSSPRHGKHKSHHHHTRISHNAHSPHNITHSAQRRRSEPPVLPSNNNTSSNNNLSNNANGGLSPFSRSQPGTPDTTASGRKRMHVLESTEQTSFDPGRREINIHSLLSAPVRVPTLVLSSSSTSSRAKIINISPRPPPPPPSSPHTHSTHSSPHTHYHPPHTPHTLTPRTPTSHVGGYKHPHSPTDSPHAPRLKSLFSRSRAPSISSAGAAATLSRDTSHDDHLHTHMHVQSQLPLRLSAATLQQNMFSPGSPRPRLGSSMSGDCDSDDTLSDFGFFDIEGGV